MCRRWKIKNLILEVRILLLNTMIIPQGLKAIRLAGSTRELLKAETVEDILEYILLTRLQAEIDSMQGQIKMWDKLIGMATITLYIDEEANPIKDHNSWVEIQFAFRNMDDNEKWFY